MKNKILEIIDSLRLLNFIPLLVMLISVPVSAEQACPYYNLGGKGCSTITDSSTCPLYYDQGSNGSSNIACSWNGSSCTDGGGDCTGNGVLPTCPANSLDGKDCGTITDPATCPTYLQVGTNGGSNIACSWNGSSCSDGGGDCTGGGSDSAPPACPPNSISSCGSNTDSATCATNYISGNPSIACYWSGSSCTDGGGNCTVEAQSSTSTQCTSGSLGWSYYNNKNNFEGYEQICGVQPASGNLTINAFDTQTWTNYTPNDGTGITGWEYWYGCNWTSNGAVSVTTTGDYTINPWSATATNWDPEYNYSWSTGVLWGYGTQENSNGYGDWAWDSSNSYAGSNTYIEGTANGDIFQAGCTTGGNINLLNTSNPVNSNVATAQSASSRKINLRSNRQTVTPSNNTDLRGFKNQNIDAFKIAEHKHKLSPNFQGGVIGGLNALCPSGFIPMNSAVLSDSSNGRAISLLTNYGAVVSATRSLAGANLTSQLVCLKDKQKPFLQGGHYWGSAKADSLSSSKDSLLVFGGPGNDKIVAKGAGAHGYGGTGKDVISVSGADSVAIGGAGNDRLIAKGKQRARLEGGLGADILTGNSGPTVLDARDGMGDDIIHCKGSLNVVVKDPGDKVTGSCKSVILAH